MILAFTYTMALVLVFYVLFMIWVYVQWLLIKTYKLDGSHLEIRSISVIVPVRNEEENIKSCLRSLLDVDYPPEKLEIIVVDDASTDGTAGVVKGLQDKNDIVKYFLAPEVQQEVSSKKAAIEFGISKSKGELIVLTDADCTYSSSWLRALSAFYSKYKPKLIVGPVSVESKGKLLGMFQTIEFVALQLVSAVTTKVNKPTMCNGANLAFEKNVFEEVGGYEGFRHITSGDDIHLMQKIVRKYKKGITYLKCKEAIVRTNAVLSLKDFFDQRIRWSAKTQPNTLSFVIALLVFMFNFVALVLLFSLLFIPDLSPKYCFTILEIAIGINFLLLILGLRFFKRLKYFWLILPEQFLYFNYAVLMGLISRIMKGNTWKGREVKR